MSYLHCPTCQRAYNLATDPLCPFCPVPATVVDASEDIVAAAEQLARAMARATPSERTAATSRLDMLALPAPGAKPVTFHGGMLRAIREAIEPSELPPPPKPQPLLTAIAYAVVEKLAARTERLLVKAPPRWRRAAQLVQSRVRALAA
ncbi:MAG: hypothetical protein JO257_37610 [Deltaproteobacteria bacterium]|nr:hypothetical protein [Deltaproteobacteria bacterium]